MDDCPRCAEIKREKAMEDETTLVEVEFKGTILMRVRNYDGEDYPRLAADDIFAEADIRFGELPGRVEGVEVDEWVARGGVRVVGDR
jgi:hypothetical protein